MEYFILQVVACGCLLSGSLENYRHAVAGRSGCSARNVLPHCLNWSLYTRFHSSSITILCNNKKEPVQVHIQYGPSVGHCVRHILQFRHASNRYQLSGRAKQRRSTNYQIRPTDWCYH